MSGAAEACAAIARTVQALYEPLRAAAAAYAHATAETTAASDLTDALRAAIALIVAAETLEDKAEQTAKTLRMRLAQTMSETGAPAIRGEYHSAHLLTAPDRVWVQEESLVPPELIVQPPPKPDLAEIGKRLRAGDRVGGCVLAGNKEPRLVLRPIKPREKTG